TCKTGAEPERLRLEELRPASRRHPVDHAEQLVRRRLVVELERGLECRDERFFPVLLREAHLVARAERDPCDPKRTCRVTLGEEESRRPCREGRTLLGVHRVGELVQPGHQPLGLLELALVYGNRDDDARDGSEQLTEQSKILWKARREYTDLVPLSEGEERIGLPEEQQLLIAVANAPREFEAVAHAGFRLLVAIDLAQGVGEVEVRTER